MDFADTETSLLSKLQSSDLSNIHHLFTAYLRPFAALNSKPQKPTATRKPATSSTKTTADARSLAKQFLSFLNRSLSLLPKRLSETPKIDPQFASQLLETYKLCLDCLDAISSQLLGKPYSVQIQRARLLHCYESWDKYVDAESEGLLLLQSLRGIWKSSKLVNKYVPDLGKENSDHDFAWLVVEIVVSLVKCVSMKQSKVENDYGRVLVMVSEVHPWFRVVDANAYEKLHRVLVTYMSKCALLLVEDLKDFNEKLVCKFCLATFAELVKSSSKDQIQKFAHRICYFLFSEQNNRSSIIDILVCVLDSVASACKIGTEITIVELLELVSYCANKCRNAGTNICGIFAVHLQNLAEVCPVSLSPGNLLMSLYATGLFISDFCAQTRVNGSTSTTTSKDLSIHGFLLDNEHRLQNLTDFLKSLKHHYSSSPKRNNLHHMHLHTPDTEPSIVAQNGKGNFISYFTALQFLCQPLAEFVNSQRKKIIITDIEDAAVAAKLGHIQDVFHQLLDVFIFCQSVSERKSDASNDNYKIVLSVAVAAFTLSLRTKQRIKESVTCIKHAISSDWIQLHGLKFLFASLHNVGVVLHRNNKMNEASMSLKLCCRASWTCLLNHCKMFREKSNMFCGDLSEDSVIGFLNEACSRTAFVLDVLYQCDSHKMNKIITFSLEKWAASKDVFDKLACPTALVKQWVKMQCKLFKDGDIEHNTKSLYSLLSFSSKLSKRELGILLEQELLLYTQVHTLNPKLCHRMRMDIIDNLLKEVYVTKTLERSRVLIVKGKELRANGVENLDDCIECLSESISIMSELNGYTHCDSIQSHQLANAYCLRALCTQEAEPNGKVLSQKRYFEDIDAAIKLWLSVDLPSLSEKTGAVFENILFLLYFVVDLLSLKGYIKFHANIYELMMRLFEFKNVPVKKLVAVLWECRRLGHALCASPIQEPFIKTLSNHCDLSNSMEFWQSCLMESQPLEVGFKQSFSFMFTNFSLGEHRHESSGSDITAGEVKQAASDILSSVPLSSGSAFVAAYLYYDLSERLISYGRFTEALSYAKEAYQLRTKLFQEKFLYSIDQQKEVCNENGEIIQKQHYSLKTFEISSSAATAAWFSESGLHDFESHVLTPWNVLQCYLESILQVGSIHEIVGNGSDAERLLLWGNSISCCQDLPLFIIAFSSILGKVYRKQQLWDLAEIELQKAQQLLEYFDGWSSFYCYKCKVVLDVSIDQQLGDLSRGRRADSNTDDSSVDRLLYAENRYRLAVKKLGVSDWKNSVSDPQEATASSTSDSSLPQGNNLQTNIPFECNCGSEETTVEQKLSRKTRKTAKILSQGQCVMRQKNVMTTRSRSRSCKTTVECDREEVLKNKNSFPCSDALNLHPKIEHFVADSEKSTSSMSKELKCWHCLPYDVRESGYLNSYIHMKWELVRRRLLLSLFTSIGKCLVNQNDRQKGHEVFFASISVLVARNQFSWTYNSGISSVMLDLIGLDIPGDVLAVERATILYHFCWFILRNYHCKGASASSDFLRIEISRILSWLKLAFLICREVPILFQKVSRLLAVLYICSSVKLLSFPPSRSEAISASRWGSYFHQASLGTHFNYQLFLHTAEKQKGSLVEVEGYLSGSISTGQETVNAIRPTPDSLLREFVSNFYQSLPPATIICISLLGVAYATLLRELSLTPLPVQAWILFSRLNSNSQPIFLLLPATSMTEDASGDDDESSSPGFLVESKNFFKRWHCPWGSTVVDDVAPMFKLILEQNYLSSSTYPLEDTKKTRTEWWTQRRKLDQHLGYFLRDLEETWFGPWKFLLCGEWSDYQHLNLVKNKLVVDLNVKCKVAVHESLLRVILAGGEHVCHNEKCIQQLILNNGCYIDGLECDTDEMPKMFKLILETIHNLDEEICVNREPIILVLDHEVQMLPWESLPILRNQEVYRMPSVSSIFASLDRCDHEKLGTGSMVFPSIDPLDAYYLLNPSGDLTSTEVEFDKWFKDQNLEGKTGTTPSIQELTIALQSHELFIYFGHGSGAQYIPGHEIQKLRTCAATLLMGCSSGSLSFSGSYSPQGAPLCYLLAGSPVIVANLWDVTDKDIDRFGKAMLDAWLRERSTESAHCGQCDAITDELESLNLNAATVKGKKKTSRKKSPETCVTSTCKPSCRHRPKVGTFMSQAREACTLPFLIGASPVCYGVPTGIKKKLDL